jgi:putative addiction module component (TIGR02574 family)
MTNAVDAALSELSAEERLALIHALWDSLSDAETPLSDAQRAELDRRLAALERDRKDAVSWDDLKAELRARS